MDYIDILIKLRKIMRSINLENKKIEKEYGLSLPQLLALHYISKEDQKATAKDIKDFLMLNASTVSGIVKRLEDKGLLTRHPMPNDRRAYYLRLTAKGSKIHKDSPITLQEKMSARLKELTPDHIAELNRNIDLLTRLMDVQDVDAAPILSSREISP